jgi:hypothetical protein
MALYQVENPYNKATSAMQGAAGSYANMQQKPYTPPKTVGGGIMSAGTGAMGGAMAGAAMGAGGGPWGAAIGAGVGLLGYFLS